MTHTKASVCPHDCPSACALDVDMGGDGTVGRIHGAAMPYVDGVICAKVARYAERVYNPDRITTPLVRTGPKGSGLFAPVSWDQALDMAAQGLAAAAADHGPQSVWPYSYAGTMGLVQRGALDRLTRIMGYAAQGKTICGTIAGAGWMAGVGIKRGVDPREMADSDLIVIWGANPAATQVQIMSLAVQAKKTRGTRLVVVDPYVTPTAAKADLHLMPKPGTDGALAVAVMHVLFRDGMCDDAYMARYTDGADRLRAHVADRGPDWAQAICGVPAQQIEAFARLYGATRKSFLRIGYGMSRSRNGAVNIHAVSCLPAITGAWACQGGGALQSNGGVFRLDTSLIDATDVAVPPGRVLDMCQIGPVLTHDAQALKGGGPVKAMIVQSTNPAVVAPDSGRVWQGLARDDLFLVVHEQIMTPTARFADVLLPATTFLEHDDLYTSYGHTFLQAAQAVIDPVGQARSNHWVVCQLAQRLGASHASLSMSAADLMDDCLIRSGLPGLSWLLQQRWHDCALPFETAHFLDGFGHGGRFRFAPVWSDAAMPALPDHWDVTEPVDAQHPFRLTTPPSRHFLNTTFNETDTSRRMALRPTLLLHHDDCARLGLGAGSVARMGNRRGSLAIHVQPTHGLQPGVAVVEGLWGPQDFIDGVGINLLVGADPVLPDGGGAFHDIAIWIKAQS